MYRTKCTIEQWIQLPRSVASHIKPDRRQCLFSLAAVGMCRKCSNEGGCWLDTAKCGIIWFIRQPHQAEKANEQGRSAGMC